MTALLLLPNESVLLNGNMKNERLDIINNVSRAVHQKEAEDTNNEINLASSDETTFYRSWTYKYTGELAFQTGTDYMYTTQSYDTSYCAAYSIDINRIIEAECLKENYKLILDIPGDFGISDVEHTIIDSVSQTEAFKVTPKDGYLSFEITPNSKLKLQNGHCYFIILNTTSLYHIEKLYSSNMRYRVLYEDLEYGDNSDQVGAQFQNMDLYVPDVKGCLPLVVTIHGGNWSTGSDKDYYDYLEDLYDSNHTRTLSNNGYIHANINYRLIGNGVKYTCLDMLQDIESALDKVKETCGNRVDMDRIAMWGYSAGGHLAIMYSLLNSYKVPVYENSNSDSNAKSFDTFVYKYKTKFLITEAGPYYFDANDSQMFTDRTWLKSIFDSLIYGRAIDVVNTEYEAKVSEYNKHLMQISPRDLGDRRVPTFTIANYYENDGYAPPNRLGETFGGGYFKSGTNYLEIIKTYTKNKDEPHSHYRDADTGFVSSYLQKLRIYL